MQEEEERRKAKEEENQRIQQELQRIRKKAEERKQIEEEKNRRTREEAERIRLEVLRERQQDEARRLEAEKEVMSRENGYATDVSELTVAVTAREETSRLSTPPSLYSSIEPFEEAPVLMQPVDVRVPTQPVSVKPLTNEQSVIQPVSVKPLTNEQSAAQPLREPIREPVREPAGGSPARAAQSPQKQPLRNPFVLGRKVGREIDENIAAHVSSFRGIVLMNPFDADDSSQKPSAEAMTNSFNETPAEKPKPVSVTPAESKNPFDEPPADPVNPFDELPAEPKNPFDEPPTQPKNPFDESPTHPVNPFDESPTEPKNPFDESPAEPKNPFDESPAEPINPFDETPADSRNPFDEPPQSKNPLDEPPAEPKNPIDADSSDEEPHNPFLEMDPCRMSTATPLPALAQRAEPFTSCGNILKVNSEVAFNRLASAAELTKPRKTAFIPGPIPLVDTNKEQTCEALRKQQKQDSMMMLQSNAPSAMMKEMEFQQEKEKLEDMRQVYETNRDGRGEGWK